MPKIWYIDYEHNCKYFVEPKFDTPERYEEQQTELRECYEAGKCFFLQKVFKKICPTCGDIFYTTASRQVYDTDRCKGKARRKRNSFKDVCFCAVCGLPFEPARHDAEYCSGKCRQKAYRYRKKARYQ